MKLPKFSLEITRKISQEKDKSDHFVTLKNDKTVAELNLPVCLTCLLESYRPWEILTENILKVQSFGLDLGLACTSAHIEEAVEKVPKRSLTGENLI